MGSPKSLDFKQDESDRQSIVHINAVPVQTELQEGVVFLHIQRQIYNLFFYKKQSDVFFIKCKLLFRKVFFFKEVIRKIEQIYLRAGTGEGRIKPPEITFGEYPVADEALV